MSAAPRRTTAGAEPYATSREALADLAQVTAVRQDLIDAAARVFHFHALRQPQIARLVAGLDDLDALAYLGRAGYRRAADVLAALDSAATELLPLDGDAREWLAAPVATLRERAESTRARMAATAAEPVAVLGAHFTDRYQGDDALKTLHRAHRSLADALPQRQDAREAFSALGDTLTGVSGPGAANSAAACGRTIEHLTAVVRHACALHTATAPTTTDPDTRARLDYLTTLAREVHDRFTATAAILHDAHHLGSARAILAAAAETQTTDSADGLSVHHRGQQIGPVRRTPDGQWATPDGGHLYQSPEGAIAHLVLARHPQPGV